MPVSNPSLAELLNGFRGSVMAGLRVALPGRVERYDVATQLVDVQPLIADTFEEEDGTVSNVRLPLITNVPVIFPGAGGMRITFPIQAGDTVLLVFADRSLDVWQSRGGETAPDDTRRHALTDAMAIPGLHPNSEPHLGADPAVITIGANAGADDFVALSSLVTAQLNALKAALNSWVPVPNDGGLALKTILTALFATWPTTVASATVKVRG